MTINRSVAAKDLGEFAVLGASDIGINAERPEFIVSRFVPSSFDQFDRLLKILERLGLRLPLGDGAGVEIAGCPPAIGILNQPDLAVVAISRAGVGGLSHRVRLVFATG